MTKYIVATVMSKMISEVTFSIAVNTALIWMFANVGISVLGHVTYFYLLSLFITSRNKYKLQ